MMRATLVTAALILAQPLAAQEMILSNPGFCEAPEAEQELAGIAYLTPNGIEAHWASCFWAEGPQDYPEGRTGRLNGQCDDGARQWTLRFDLSVNEDGRVTLFAQGANPLPDYYFPCSGWGRKNP